MISGGDGYYIFKNNSRNHEIGGRDMDYFISYVEKMSPIMTGIERRITFVEI